MTRGAGSWAAGLALGAATVLVLATGSRAHAQTPPSPAEASRYTALLAAAARGDAAEIAVLVKAGAAPDVRDGRGRTPLHVAAHRRRREAMRALVAAGADPDALDADRYDIVTIAAVAGDAQTLEAALALGGSARNVTSRYDGTALIAAAHLGHADIVRMLIRAGAPLDHVNNLGWTALIESIVLGDGGARHLATLEALVEAGADVNLPDRAGQTPLALARAGAATPRWRRASSGQGRADPGRARALRGRAPGAERPRPRPGRARRGAARRAGRGGLVGIERLDADVVGAGRPVLVDAPPDAAASPHATIASTRPIGAAARQVRGGEAEAQQVVRGSSPSRDSGRAMRGRCAAPGRDRSPRARSAPGTRACPAPSTRRASRVWAGDDEVGMGAVGVRRRERQHVRARARRAPSAASPPAAARRRWRAASLRDSRAWSRRACRTCGPRRPSTSGTCGHAEAEQEAPARLLGERELRRRRRLRVARVDVGDAGGDGERLRAREQPARDHEHVAAARFRHPEGAVSPAFDPLGEGRGG